MQPAERSATLLHVGIFLILNPFKQKERVYARVGVRAEKKSMLIANHSYYMITCIVSFSFGNFVGFFCRGKLGSWAVGTASPG